MEENKTVAEVTPEVAPAVEETKKPLLNASVAPEDFDWDAFENDDVYGGDIAGIEEQYNQTLSKVVEGEVVEGVVTSVSKREVIAGVNGNASGNFDLTVPFGVLFKRFFSVIHMLREIPFSDYFSQGNTYWVRPSLSRTADISP